MTEIRIYFEDKVVRVSDGGHLIDAKVTLACLGPGGSAGRLPDMLKRALKENEIFRCY